jgi:hypothetical protein
MRRAVLLGTVVAAVAVAMLGALPSGVPAAGTRAARHGVTLVTVHGRAIPGRWQAWADASRMPTPATRIRLRLAACPAMPRAAGCVYTRRPRTIWLRVTAGDPRGTLLHELGHTFDLLVLSNRDRAGVSRIFHRTRRAWWKGRIPTAEWFAEGYSWCARYAHIASLRRYASYRYRPTAAQHQRLCRLIVRAARDRHPAQPAPAAPPTTRPDPPPPPPPSQAPGTVPGDPNHDPGPTAPENPNAPVPAPSPVPGVPVPVPPLPAVP